MNIPSALGSPLRSVCMITLGFFIAVRSTLANTLGRLTLCEGLDAMRRASDEWEPHLPNRYLDSKSFTGSVLIC